MVVLILEWSSFRGGLNAGFYYTLKLYIFVLFVLFYH